MPKNHLVTRFLPIALGFVLSWLGVACHHSASVSGPSPEDFMAAKAAMPISELLFKVRAGVPRSEIVEEVTHRHLASPVTPEVEAQLVSHNAGAALLAAVKDPHNILTEKQQEAYGQLAANSTPQPQLAGQPLELREAQVRNAQHEQELQRRNSIARENIAQTEQAAQLRAAKEHAQANSRPRLEGGRELFGSVYEQPRPYATPVRNYSSTINGSGVRPRATATPQAVDFTLNNSR